MCGIAGFINFSRDFSAEKLREIGNKMIKTLHHRGPDGEGIWFEPTSNIVLTHKRLAVIDRSPKGQQPMFSSNNRYVIVYNGEIYNFREIRIYLQKKGYPFQGRSDTEVLLASIDHWGVKEALKYLNGMFAFALWDREGVLTLCRDRLGKKPLYYAKQGNFFFFASELKALQAHPDFKAKINHDAVTAYLRYNYVPAPSSIYEDTFKLPAGSILTLRNDFSNNSYSIKKYWDVSEKKYSFEANFSEEDLIAELHSLLENAVKIRMTSDVPLGAFLSGGVDSSVIVGLMQSLASEKIKTFSIGFHETAYNEATESKLIAEHIGTDHTEFYVTSKESMAVIPELPLVYDEPFSDVSQIPTILISTLARQKVTVALSGDGGDELFGGYNRYIWAPRLWEKIQYIPQSVRLSLSNLSNIFPHSVWNKLLNIIGVTVIDQQDSFDKINKVLNILKAKNKEEVYLYLISNWQNPKQIATQGNDTIYSLLKNNSAKKSEEFVNYMMLNDLNYYLPDDILVKLDRASMSVSLESRVPLLDYRVVEFSQRIPLSTKIKNGNSKWILKKILARYIPEHLIERPKKGFAVPMGVWLRGPLKDWAESLLDPNKLKEENFFKPDIIRHKWEQHLSGKYNWQHNLWNILMFQAWFSQNKDRITL